MTKRGSEKLQLKCFLTIFTFLNTFWWSIFLIFHSSCHLSEEWFFFYITSLALQYSINPKEQYCRVSQYISKSPTINFSLKTSHFRMIHQWIWRKFQFNSVIREFIRCIAANLNLIDKLGRAHWKWRREEQASSVLVTPCK